MSMISLWFAYNLVQSQVILPKSFKLMPVKEGQSAKYRIGSLMFVLKTVSRVSFG